MTNDPVERIRATQPFHDELLQHWKSHETSLSEGDNMLVLVSEYERLSLVVRAARGVVENYDENLGCDLTFLRMALKSLGVASQ